MEAYNREAEADALGAVLFELYHGALRDAAARHPTSVALVAVRTAACEPEPVPTPAPAPASSFGALYYGFAVYWGGRLLRSRSGDWCRRPEQRPARRRFVARMRALAAEAPRLERESWTHNHYGYFSTMFFTQDVASELALGPAAMRGFARFLRSSMRTSTSLDYVGECVEHLLLFCREPPASAGVKRAVVFLLQRRSGGGGGGGGGGQRSRHELTTASIAPLSAYYLAATQTQARAKQIESRRGAAATAAATRRKPRSLP